MGGVYLQDDGNAASNFRFEKNNIYGNDLSSGNNYGLVNRTGTEIDLKKNFWGRPAVRGLIRRMMLMTLEPVPSPTPTPPQNPTRSKPKSEGFNLMWTDDPTLAEVFVGGANVNLEMVKAGFAEAHRGRPARGFNTVLYQNAEKDARDQERGMWVQNSDDYVSPKAWRENKRKSSSS